MGKRIALWDNLKLFLIFLVVLGHLTLQYFYSSQMFCTVTMVIYTFHMPAFVFISGLFSKKAINGETPPVKRSLSFIAVYLFVRVLNYLSNIIFGVHSYFSIFSSKDIPWYMMAMALWYMITWAVRKIDAKYVLVTSIVMGCFIGYMSGDTDFLCIMRLTTFFPFFYIGYLLDLDDVNKITSTKKAKIFSAVFFIAFVIIVTVTINIEDYGCLLRLAYYVIVSLLIFSIISLCPRKEFKFTAAGKKTLQIYVYHRPLLYIIKNAGLFYLVKQVGAGWEWIAIAIVMLLTALLCFDFWKKPLDFIMNPKLKGEKYATAK